jgi:primosomal protein N' (replication factor Y)
MQRQPDLAPQPGPTGLPSLRPAAGPAALEAALQQHFPEIRVLRFDRDEVRGKDAFERQLALVDPERPCILVGTQMLAKGHHLPGIGLAVMLDADQLLYSSDFRAPERLAQAVVQVAGRSGRVTAGSFVLQTRHPEHPLLLQICQGDYLEVARSLLRDRVDAGLPPARPLAMVRAESRAAADAVALLSQIADAIADDGVEIAGPVESLLQRRAGYWRFQLWLLARDRTAMQRVVNRLPASIERLREAARLRWHIDVDPLEL